jgi:hypothetical protein
MKSLLRAAALAISLTLLIGCVWFAQKQAAPAMMPGSKSGPPTPVILSGSKSFTGATSVASEVLKMQPSNPLLPEAQP